MALLTKEQLDALEATHGEIIHVLGSKDKSDVPRWEVVLRKPKRSEWKRARAMFHNPAQVSEANETIVRMCAVYPIDAALDALLEKYPACPEAIAKTKDFQEAVGLSTDEAEK